MLVNTEQIFTSAGYRFHFLTPFSARYLMGKWLVFVVWSPVAGNKQYMPRWICSRSMLPMVDLVVFPICWETLEVFLIAASLANLIDTHCFILGE